MQWNNYKEAGKLIWIKYLTTQCQLQLWLDLGFKQTTLKDIVAIMETIGGILFWSVFALLYQC